jgi:hypothetical protein
MRNLCWLALLSCSWASADTQVKVEANTFLRLPAAGASLLLNRLELGVHATLILPASLKELHVDQLLLAANAHIGIVPDPQDFLLSVGRAELAPGSYISARGAAGNINKPATPGRNLHVRLEHVQLTDLTLDVRGGAGAAGVRGQDGVAGESGGCFWGQADAGASGQAAGAGEPGAAGGAVRLEVPADFPAQALQINLQGGMGGPAGVPGMGGRGGAMTDCMIYDVDAARDGQSGSVSHAGGSGAEGSFKLLRLSTED